MTQDLKDSILEIKKEAIEKVDQDVQEIYNEHKKVLGVLLLLLMELFDRYSLEGKFKVNRYQKAEILKNIEAVIIREAKGLAERDISISKNVLNEIIMQSYEWHIGLWGNTSSIVITPILTNEIIFREYKGDKFNNRITDNKRKLANRIYVEFDKAMINNSTLEELSHNIQEVFKQSNYESYRLLMTEQTRVFNEIQIMAFIVSGAVEKVTWVAALSEKTCPYCEMMDGSIFELDDLNRPEIPAHVLCQCCWVPV